VIESISDAAAEEAVSERDNQPQPAAEVGEQPIPGLGEPQANSVVEVYLSAYLFLNELNPNLTVVQEEHNYDSYFTF
jgi:hypothetical protein